MTPSVQSSVPLGEPEAGASGSGWSDAPPPLTSQRSMRRVMASAVICCEGLSVALAMFVSRSLLPILLVLALVMLVLVPSLLRRRSGYLVGWICQVAVVVLGWWLRSLWVLALCYVPLWWYALHAGAGIDRRKARWFAEHPDEH